jgi:cell division protein FtsN
MNFHKEKTISPSISKQFFPFYSIKKTALIRSRRVHLISLLLLFSLPFLIMKAYSSSKLFNERNQKKDTVQLKEIPSFVENTEIASYQLITSADTLLATKNKPAVAREKVARIVVFKEEGGNLYSLALKHYQNANETLFDLILQANPDITDVRQINDDQKIVLPVITAESYVEKVSEDNYRVHVGTYETRKIANFYLNKISDLKKVLIVYAHEFSPKDTWHRLMIGHFNSKEEALKTVNLLNERGIIYIPPNLR